MSIQFRTFTGHDTKKQRLGRIIILELGQKRSGLGAIKLRPTDFFKFSVSLFHKVYVVEKLD